MHLCVLVFRFHVCICNSTPICFLKKAGVQEKQKGPEDLWKRIELDENMVRRGWCAFWVGEICKD